MGKYMVFYNAKEPAGEFMAHSSPEQIQIGMNAWALWKNEIEKTVKFEFGMPLQIVSRLTANKITDQANQVSGYSIMEGDEAVVIAALQSHPHLKREGASIDLLEMLSPGEM